MRQKYTSVLSWDLVALNKMCLYILKSQNQFFHRFGNFLSWSLNLPRQWPHFHYRTPLQETTRLWNQALIWILWLWEKCKCNSLTRNHVILEVFSWEVEPRHGLQQLIFILWGLTQILAAYFPSNDLWQLVLNALKSNLVSFFFPLFFPPSTSEEAVFHCLEFKDNWWNPEIQQMPNRKGNLNFSF